jgi:hypothetical protein
MPRARGRSAPRHSSARHTAFSGLTTRPHYGQLFVLQVLVTV